MNFSIKDINNRRLNNMWDSFKEYSEGHDFYWEFDEDVLEDGIHSVGAALPDNYDNIEDRKNILEDNIWMSIVMLNRLYNREQIKEDDKRQEEEERANKVFAETIDELNVEVAESYIRSANVIFHIRPDGKYVMTKSVFPNERLYNIAPEETIDNYLKYYKKVLLLGTWGSILDVNFDLE